MKETIISFIGSIINTLLSHLLGHEKPISEAKKKYDTLRNDVAEALTMYANCLHQPLDIAKLPDGKLPEDYCEGSRKFRELGAKMDALAKTMPNNIKDVPIKQTEIIKASKCLIGLSNNFSAPYNCTDISPTLRNICEYEKELRNILDISGSNGD